MQKVPEWLLKDVSKCLSVLSNYRTETIEKLEKNSSNAKELIELINDNFLHDEKKSKKGN